MKDICTAITSIVAMVLGFCIWLIVFLFNVCLAFIGAVILAIAYPFIWIYDKFKK